MNMHAGHDYGHFEGMSLDKRDVYLKKGLQRDALHAMYIQGKMLRDSWMASKEKESLQLLYKSASWGHPPAMHLLGISLRHVSYCECISKLKENPRMPISRTAGLALSHLSSCDVLCVLPTVCV